MKKEIFNKLIDEFRKLQHSSYKATFTDEIESHCFGQDNNPDLSEMKAMFAKYGWKGTNKVHFEFEALRTKSMKVYLTALYDHAKDKISLSIFEVGYKFSQKKNRYFPYKKNNPIFCWSKHMYSFVTRDSKPQPRIQKGNIIIPFIHNYTKVATQVLMNTQANVFYSVNYKHIMNTKTNAEVLNNAVGMHIPQVLIKKFQGYEILDLYATLKDPNEINTLCQYMSKNDVSPSLCETISMMLFNGTEHGWLIRDSMLDCIRLKTKELSFKVKSAKRWQEEHQRRSRLVMLKGVANIKTHDIYKNALDGFEYEYELIDNKERLIQESLEMSHCVATYAHKINSGNCAIFSIMYENQRYTLEVGQASFYTEDMKKMLKNPLVCVQLKGKYNAAPPELLKKAVDYKLSKDNIGLLKLNEAIERMAVW